MSNLHRRQFLQRSAALAASASVASHLLPAVATSSEPSPSASLGSNESFRSQWGACHDCVWLGPEFWANPLQDWRLAARRLECHHAALDRNVHLLTRQLGPQDGELRMSVRLGRMENGPIAKGAGSAGFRIGIRGVIDDYRHALIYGAGIDAGLTAAGGLFIGKVDDAQPGAIRLETDAVELRLRVQPEAGAYTITLSAHDAQNELLGEVSRSNVAAEQCVGNIALVANYGRLQPHGKAAGKGAGKEDGKPANKKNEKQADTRPAVGVGRWWFDAWTVDGTKLTAHEDHAFGPILFNQYTLSDRVLKMTAQMPPLGTQDSRSVSLQVLNPGASEWSALQEATIDPAACTATFRIENWDDTRDHAYRLAYTMIASDGTKDERFWHGAVRRDPVDKPEFVVADISCNTHAAFPNAPYVANVAKLDPDIIAFVGDQFYESSGGYGIVKQPLETATIDYLRKWYLHGWTWRELTRDRPSISLPDDHDVYQGNIWGEDGAARHGTQEMGGYDMSPEWVNVVHRTQTSHHPDPYDPTPVRQDISVFYGPLTYGQISFAIVADRMFKSGPEGKTPPTGARGDHVVDPDFDPSTADLPGLQLLGERQLTFLRAWAADWRGADMKAVVSQTIFAAMATTHGGNRDRLVADYDANGWPQTPRNQALREIRKAFAVHIAGDQHLPAVVHYGVDEHRDGPVAFAGPAVNVGYPRWWEPDEPGANRAADAPENTGDFRDHFGNLMTVCAVANGDVEPRKPLLEMLHDRASGLGIVRFNKPKREITFECWPLLADTADATAQFPGWPVTVNMLDNYHRRQAAQLPRIEIRGLAKPVVQVVRESDGEIEYTLRIAGAEFQPPVFAPGLYTVLVLDPEGGRRQELKNIEAAVANENRLLVTFG